MKAYSLTTRLKLGLFLGAIVIAVASLAYSHQLINRLREREQIVVQLWASALERVSQASSQAENPYQPEFRELLDLLAADPGNIADVLSLDRTRAALRWAQGMPPTTDLSFILDNVLQRNFDIPAIIADGTGHPVLWHNVRVPATLTDLSSDDSLRAMRRLGSLMRRMEAGYEPIEMELVDATGNTVYRQRIFYGDSRLILALRMFPYAQLVFGSLFILVGYLGFSHVRRSEQSNLWVGMAKEAAHQLGTPISSLMGWTALLRSPDTQADQREMAVAELEVDAERLRRVANRFSDIGSMPKLSLESVGDVIETCVAYIERRLPSQSRAVELSTTIDGTLTASLNAELFSWVVENLLKNALDALEGNGGQISVHARHVDGQVWIDVTDSGKGIDRRDWKNVFRPGFSTKRRGWGLGLSLAKRIVEDYHGGTLSLVRSRVGEGTTFRIMIPAQVA